MNNNLNNAIESDGASQDKINMAANDEEITEIKSTLSGLFIILN